MGVPDCPDRSSGNDVVTIRCRLSSPPAGPLSDAQRGRPYRQCEPDRNRGDETAVGHAYAEYGELRT